MPKQEKNVKMEIKNKALIADWGNDSRLKFITQ